MSFPRERRLTRRIDFVRCYDGGRRFFSRNFVLFVLKRDDSVLSWRLGTAVTRKTGSAVRRNRVRRIIREVFRLERQHVPQGYDYVVVPKRGLVPRTVTLASATAELLPLLYTLASGKAGLASAARKSGPAR